MFGDHIKKKQEEIRKSISDSFSPLEKGGPGSGRHRNATDHFIEHKGKHYVDQLDPDTEEVKFKAGDKVKYQHEGKEYRGTVSDRKHPTEDQVLEIDKDDASKKENLLKFKKHLEKNDGKLDADIEPLDK